MAASCGMTHPIRRAAVVQEEFGTAGSSLDPASQQEEVRMALRGGGRIYSCDERNESGATLRGGSTSARSASTMSV